jgi:hypothetical protein
MSGFSFDPQAYGAAAAELLAPRREAPLGAGEPNRAAEARLVALSVDSLLAGRPVADRAAAQACLAGLWLYHDFLDESHAISQDLHTPEGSYWHGILHRRDGDYDNAKYWVRRVGKHPVYPRLAQFAARAAASCHGIDPAVQYLATQGAWDPFRFVDSCRAASGPTADVCREIQAREWELLFDHCYQAARAK